MTQQSVEKTEKNWSLKQRILLALSYGLIRLLSLTYRFKTEGTDTIAQYIQRFPDRRFAVACWHENLLAGTLSQAGRRLCLLISPSFDGDLIAHVAEKFGFTTARGSSSRGGTGAIKSYLRKAREGWNVAITVDGPKGPRHLVKEGIVQIASMVNADVIPLAAIADRTWILSRSWDQFRIPKPFSTIHVYYAEPVSIPAADTIDPQSEPMRQLLASIEFGLMNLESRHRDTLLS